MTTLAATGISLTAYAITLTAVTALWCAVPLALGVLIARNAPPASARLLPAVWFVLALGGVAATVSIEPVTILLRILIVGSWFFAFATFPTGELGSRWAQIAVAAALLWTGVLTLVPAVRTAEAAGDPVWWTLEVIVYVSIVGTIFVGQIVRYRTGSDDIRRQLRLLLVVFVPFIALAISSAFLNPDQASFGYGSLGGVLLFEASNLATTLLIACIGLAVIRHGAYGARVVFNRALVGILAVIIATAVYLVTVGALVALTSAMTRGWPNGRWLPGVLGAVAAAAVLSAVERRLTRWIDRLVYGDAADPVALIGALGRILPHADSPRGLLDDLAVTLMSRLRFDALTITFAETSVPQVALGTAPDSARHDVVHLMLGDAPLATLDVTLRPGQRRLSARDRRAFDAATGALAAGVTTYRLTLDLTAARLAELAGREEERRVLRGRLHDEVGPLLATAIHRVDAASQDLTMAPDRAAAHLQRADAALHDASLQVREVSRALRPPALDELGLVAAIESFAFGLGLTTNVTVSGALALPQALEGALYRIAVEALVNVERHAEATAVAITLRQDDRSLTLEVTDDGVGCAPDVRAGVGLASMRERATAWGGTVSLTSAAGGGTQLRCVLPVSASPDTVLPDTALPDTPERQPWPSAL